VGRLQAILAQVTGPGRQPPDQLCPTCGPFEGCVRPSLGFSCCGSILHVDNQSLFW